MTSFEDLNALRSKIVSIEYHARTLRSAYKNRDTAGPHLEEIELAARVMLIKLTFAQRAINATTPIEPGIRTEKEPRFGGGESIHERG